MFSAAALHRSPQPENKVSSVPKCPRKGSAARIGLILLDSSLRPVYCNPEALSIFAYPNQPAKARHVELPRSIRSMIGKKSGADDSPTTHIVSGRRRYLCRIFFLEPESNDRSAPTILITVERDRRMLFDLVVRFQLTGREVETVRHLADGLTSKEIAQQMNISPNTVKTLLRLVMIKMGVTTRSGVIGKLISA
jgi:DNA-binding CsgD family transcriptional regulator